MRQVGTACLVVSLLLGMGTGQIVGADARLASLSRDSAPARYFDEPAQVTRVKDGDTFVAQWPDGHREDVRPAGWDAPELFQSSPDCFATEAMLHAAKLLSERTIWLSRADRLRDRHGRLLAVVYLDSARTARVGNMMVSQGFAGVLDFPAGTELEPLLAEAQAAERGMWGECP